MCLLQHEEKLRREGINAGPDGIHVPQGGNPVPHQVDEFLVPPLRKQEDKIIQPPKIFHNAQAPVIPLQEKVVNTAVIVFYLFF